MAYNTETLKTKTFPWKLHEMLELAEQEDFSGIVSWLPDGKSFKVYNPTIFVQKIMPNFFQQSKYKSFQRQLNLWGFERLTAGPGKGGYTRNKYFLRTNRNEICHIQRRKIKCIKDSAKKKPAKIIAFTPSKINSENGNSTGEQTRMQSSGAVSVVSLNCSDSIASISSDSDSEQPFPYTPMPLTTQISPIDCPTLFPEPIEDECPRTGDCLDFEGRSYFFVDEEEIEAKEETNTTHNIAALLRKSQPRSLAEITFSPSTLAGISLYREFFSRDLNPQRLVNQQI